MDWIPAYIRDRAEYLPGHVVTAEEFNGWVNRLVIQGDNNTDGVVDLYSGYEDHSTRLETVETRLLGMEDFTAAYKDKLDSVETGAEVNQSITVYPAYSGGVLIATIVIDGSVTPIYADVSGGIVQSDWAQTDIAAVDYIQNKPANLVQDSSYVHTDNNYTTSEKNKLNRIAETSGVWAVLDVVDVSFPSCLEVPIADFDFEPQLTDVIEVYINGLKLNKNEYGLDIASTVLQIYGLPQTLDFSTCSSNDYVEVVVRRF